MPQSKPQPSPGPPPRLEVSRGRDGSIRINSQTLYDSPVVQRQLAAARRLALQLGLIKTP